MIVKITPEEARRRVEEDEDFVNLGRYEHSVAKVKEKHPDGVPDEVVAKALMLTVEGVRAAFDEAREWLREKLSSLL